MEKFKLNVSNDAEYLNEGLGITNERVGEIPNQIEEIIALSEDNITLTQLFKSMAEIAQSVEELAFIFFIFGRTMGAIELDEELG